MADGAIVVIADDPDPAVERAYVLLVPPRSTGVEVLMELVGYGHPAVATHPGTGLLWALVRHAATEAAHVLEVDRVNKTYEQRGDLGPMDPACGAIHVDPKGTVVAFVPLEDTIHTYESGDLDTTWEEV
jgi:hypothetical protein